VIAGHRPYPGAHGPLLPDSLDFLASSQPARSFVSELGGAVAGSLGKIASERLAQRLSLRTGGCTDARGRGDVVATTQTKARPARCVRPTRSTAARRSRCSTMAGRSPPSCWTIRHVLCLRGRRERALSPKTGCPQGSTKLAEAMTCRLGARRGHPLLRDFGSGRVLSCPKTGCPEGPKVLVMDEPHARAVAFDGERLFWARRRRGRQHPRVASPHAARATKKDHRHQAGWIDATLVHLSDCRGEASAIARFTRTAGAVPVNPGAGAFSNVASSDNDGSSTQRRHPPAACAARFSASNQTRVAGGRFGQFDRLSSSSPTAPILAARRVLDEGLPLPHHRLPGVTRGVRHRDRSQLRYASIARTRRTSTSPRRPDSPLRK